MTLTHPDLLWLLVPATLGFAALARHEQRTRPRGLAWGRCGVRTAVTAALLAVLSGPITQETQNPAAMPEPADVPEPADAAAAPRVVVYVAPEPWHTAAEVRPVLTQVLANANAAPAEPAVWLRTAAERRTLTAAEARGGPLPAWAAPAAAEAPPLARLVPDLVAEPGAPHLPPDGAAAAVPVVHVVSAQPPSAAQCRALELAGWQWTWRPLPTRRLQAGPLLAPLAVEPAQPEQGTPITVRTQLWLPAAAASAAGTRTGAVRWRLHLDGTPLDWQAVSLPVPATGNGHAAGSADSAYTRLAPAELQTTVESTQWPPHDQADATAGSVASLAPIARHVRLEVEVSGGPTLTTARGVIFRPPPRWFVHTAQPIDREANRLVELARRSMLRAETVPRLPAGEELFGYAGGIVPLRRLIELNEADWQRLLRFVEHGGGLIVPTLRPEQRPGELPPPIPYEVAQQLASLLPVRVGPRSEVEGTPQAVQRFEEEGEVARVSILFVIDNSGSMAKSVGRLTRSGFVREAVKQALANLNEEDRAAIIFFDSNVSGRIGPLPVTVKNRRRLESFLADYPEPSRGTAIALACQAAVQMLATESAAAKHVVLLSDGQETEHPFTNFRERREDFLRNGISCSVVGVGTDYDKDTLLAIHTPSNGLFHFTTSETVELYRERVPQIFLREVAMSQERGQRLLEANETGETPEVPLMAWRGQLSVTATAPFRFITESAPFPNVLAASRLEPWPTSTTALAWRPPPNAAEMAEAASTTPQPREAEPLLVSWRVGQGEVAAWGSTFGPETLPDWHDWPEFAAFLGRWWRALGNPDPGVWRLSGARWETAAVDGNGDDGTATLVAQLVRADGGAPLPRGTRMQAVLVAAADPAAQPATHTLPPARLDRDGTLRLAVPSAVAADYGALRLVLPAAATAASTPAEPAAPAEAVEVAVLPLPPSSGRGPAVAAPEWLVQAPPAEIREGTAPPAMAAADEPTREPRREQPAYSWIAALLLAAAALFVVDVFLRR